MTTPYDADEFEFYASQLDQLDDDDDGQPESLTGGGQPSNDQSAAGATSSKRTISARIEADLRAWGYELWLNDLDDRIWNGSKQVDDVLRSEIRTRARDEGYGKARLLSALDDAMVAIAARNRRHPVREYLNALQWDGKDHIAQLASHFKDKHDPIIYPQHLGGGQLSVFHAFLARWLIGAVAKAYGDTNACGSNFVFTLAGIQDKGKSFFAQWLCPLPELFLEMMISPDNKDIQLARASTFIWEIGELGATTGRADVEALKAFITTKKVSGRQAYGRFEIHKTALASYIGTVNADGSGFLVDPTGNRRFVVVELTDIDWSYSETVDVSQLWAQAVQLWRDDPTGYRLLECERTVQQANNEAHTIPDPIADALDKVFEIDPSQTGWKVRSIDIFNALNTHAGISLSNPKQLGRSVAVALRKYWGIERKESNGATWYIGLKQR